MGLKAWVKRKVTMKVIISILDWIWDLKILTGYRSEIARAMLVILPAYQAAATDINFINMIHFDLPDINPVILAGLMAYFGGKINGFVKRHNTEGSE